MSLYEWIYNADLSQFCWQEYPRNELCYHQGGWLYISSSYEMHWIFQRCNGCNLLWPIMKCNQQIFFKMLFCWNNGAMTFFYKSVMIIFARTDLKCCVHYILLVCFVSFKDGTCQTRKNVSYFTSEALFVLEIIKI